MTPVQFTVTVHISTPPQLVWDELVDWKGHEAWIPATRIEVDGDDPTAVGATFTAWTGPGRLALEDRMRIAECTWDDDSASGRCVVDKLGPALSGRAGFTVVPADGGTRVDWFEDVAVPRLPRFLAPIAGRLGAVGFKVGMWRLGRLLAKRRTRLGT